VNNAMSKPSKCESVFATRPQRYAETPRRHKRGPKRTHQTPTAPAVIFTLAAFVPNDDRIK